MQETQKTDSSFRRNLIIIGCCWAAIFIFVVGGIVGATLSPPATPTPTTTTTSPICPRQWVSGVGWVAIVDTRCNIYSAGMGVDSQMPLPKACTGVDMVTGEAIPSGCDGILGSQAFTTTNTGTTAITPPAPVSTPAQCQAQHDYYSPQGCIGSMGVGTTNTGSTGSAAITPPPAPVSTPTQCPARSIDTPQGCIGSLNGQTIIYGTPTIQPRMYPPPPKGKCVKTATTWTCIPTRPVTG